MTRKPDKYNEIKIFLPDMKGGIGGTGILNG